MRLSPFAALALIAPLAACSTVIDTVKGPSMSPVGYPAALVPQQQDVMAMAPPRYAPNAASSNSLWRAGARTFFNDQRASRIGDILTVQIQIADSARTQNQTTASRGSTASVGVPNFLGLESSLGRILPGGYDPANAINTQSTTSNQGQGAVNRAEQINLTIAAVVTALLPNGNMVIQGTQEVRTNAELRQLTVAGIVRPEDISSTNTINHSQIAEARISYGGRGDISRVQRTPAGQALVEKFSPF
ncbi:flagellar basal body L-ring protein FlgH [Caulobacter sp. NIBR2454]|uniref:flagellar basal body L-ring protein FlgH n=1 Tax=Caulobacter sp. NIBR2454 TaxID=3015996 RepID=UPI0022B6B41A|nr:flagellar basal body L-ring protein FlgH [Caulobacter sp. NIBR2454]